MRKQRAAEEVPDLTCRGCMRLCCYLKPSGYADQMATHADPDDRSRVVPLVGHSVVTIAALLPISGVLGLAALGTDFYLGHTGKSFGGTLAFLFLGPILVLLAL